MGRVDPAVLPVRRARSLEKSMVLVRLLGGRRRNAQRATLIRSAFFCFLALMAKKMDLDVARARRIRGDFGVNCFAVAFAHSGIVDRDRCCCWYKLASFPKI